MLRLVVLSGFAAAAFTLLVASQASASSPGARPSAPRGVVAVSATNTVAVRFLPPVSNGGRRITRYDIEARPGNRIFTCRSTRCSLHGLSSGVAYSFVVAAVTGNGRGQYSRRSNSVTLKASGALITFNANGGTGVMAPEAEVVGGATSLETNTFNLANSAFASWNTAANGSGTSYANGGTYTFTSSVTLYAQWTLGAVSVTFNANGGAGIMSSEVEQLNAMAILTPNAFIYAGHTFAGWNTVANGTGTNYADGANYSFTTSTTLYAQWSAALPSGPFPGAASSNWSGYVVTGQNGGYQSVSAQWTVPAINCAAVPNGVVSAWVGVNGDSAANPGLFQDGTSSQCIAGQASSFAWWTDADQGFGAQALFGVNAGDVIFAEVAQNSQGSWVYTVKDLTTGLTSSSPEAYNGQGLSAEWIVEDPTDGTTNALFPLADFGPVTFSNLGLSVSGLAWTLPPYSDAVEMVDANGGVMTLPAPVQGNGTAATFTVYYESST